MKKILFFELRLCPHCKKARRFIDQLQADNPLYQSLEIEYIDERKNKELAAQYDYYLVPSLYIDNQKVHEGKMKAIEEMEEIFKKALSV
mgnify:CR=1 FL=1